MNSKYLKYWRTTQSTYNVLQKRNRTYKDKFYCKQTTAIKLELRLKPPDKSKKKRKVDIPVVSVSISNIIHVNCG